MVDTSNNRLAVKEDGPQAKKKKKPCSTGKRFQKNGRWSAQYFFNTVLPKLPPKKILKSGFFLLASLAIFHLYF